MDNFCSLTYDFFTNFFIVTVSYDPCSLENHVGSALFFKVASVELENRSNTCV